MYNFINLQLHVPNGLNISGQVQCNERKAPEYRVSHRNPITQEEIPGPHYEIEVSSILSQLLAENTAKNFFETKFDDEEMEKKRRKKLVSGRHILVGKDFLPYVCCPRLYEVHLTVVTKLWLTHQVLFAQTGHNINHFECFLRANESTFEDWLENNKEMKNVSGKEKDSIRADKSLFMKVKEIYEKEKLDGKKRLHADYVADSVLKALDAKVSIELV